MDVESLLHKLRTLLGEIGEDPEVGASPYVPLALDSLVSVLNVIRAAKLTIAAGASRTAVDNMVRAHMLGRMQREAVFIGHLAEQPAAELEALLRARQAEPGPRKPRARTGVRGDTRS